MRGLDRCDIAIGEIDHADEAGLLGRLGHGEGFLGVCRQRLFAEHVLAGGERLHRRGVVHVIGRDVGHRVKVAPGERLLKRGEASLDVVLFAERLEPRLLGVDGADDLHALDLGEMRGLGVGHAAGAEKQQTHRKVLSQRRPASPALCNRGPRSTIGSMAFSTGTFGAAWTVFQAPSTLLAQRTALRRTLPTVAS